MWIWITWIYQSTLYAASFLKHNNNNASTLRGTMIFNHSSKETKCESSYIVNIMLCNWCPEETRSHSIELVNPEYCALSTRKIEVAPGPLFTQQKGVLLQDLKISWSREIGCLNDRISLQFDRHLGSAAAEVPVKRQGDYKNWNANTVASRLHARDLMVRHSPLSE